MSAFDVTDKHLAVRLRGPRAAQSSVSDVNTARLAIISLLSRVASILLLSRVTASPDR